jgi:hypothetical protein
MERATDVQHIAAIEAAGLRDCRDAGALTECLRNRSRFAAPRGGARPGDDGNLSQHHGRILHEHAVGVLRQRRQPLESAAERLQRLRIVTVLARGALRIDCSTLEVCELALGKLRTNFSD